MNTIKESLSHNIILSIIDDIIIKIEKDHALVKHIQLLPSDITRYIYEEYIESQQIYEKFVLALEDTTSQMLNPILIRPMIPMILSKPKYISVCRQIPEFDIAYKEHKLRKQKCFRLMNNGDSFATTILFCKYH